MHFDYDKRLATKSSKSNLSVLLNKMTMENVFCTHSTLSSPWSIEMPIIEKCMMFHLVIKGQINIKNSIDSNPEVLSMSMGDFILLPKGHGHILYSDTPDEAVPLHDLPIQLINDHFEQLSFGGGGSETILLCGAITFNHPLTLKLLETLPNEILIKKNNKINQSIQTLVGLLSNEALNEEAGATSIVSRISDLLVITALRQYLENKLESNNLSWLGALEDTRIAKAIQLVHNSPSTHWSLGELATRVGMSRTSFSIEFKRLVGNSPMDYLTHWRMSLAYNDFKNTKASILSVAMDYGYQSESAFARTFKKVIGMSPGEVKKQA